MSFCVYSQSSVLNFYSFKGKISELLARFAHPLIRRARCNMGMQTRRETGSGDGAVLTL